MRNSCMKMLNLFAGCRSYIRVHNNPILEENQRKSVSNTELRLGLYSQIHMVYLIKFLIPKHIADKELERKGLERSLCVD